MSATISLSESRGKARVMVRRNNQPITQMATSVAQAQLQLEEQGRAEGSYQFD